MPSPALDNENNEAGHADLLSKIVSHVAETVAKEHEAPRTPQLIAATDDKRSAGHSVSADDSTITSFRYFQC